MTPERILTVGPSWVGDMVMAQALFIELAERFAGCQIDVLAPAWSLPVIARMQQVRNGIDVDVSHGEFGLLHRRRLGHALRQNRYTRAIILPRSFKSALVPWFANIPIRSGFRGEMRYGLINDVRVLDKTILDQTVKRFVALGRERGDLPESVPYPRLTVSPENQADAMADLGLDPGRPAVALMPGAEYGPAKCWPLENFRTIARMLGDAGYAVWVLGSTKDAASGRAIAEGGLAQNLCGRTGLADVIDLLAYCDHAISNDSGLMHVASAVGTRVHALYGSSTPEYTPPLTAKRTIHFLDLECSPCFERRCPLLHLNCLTGIAPETVFRGIMIASKENSPK